MMEKEERPPQLQPGQTVMSPQAQPPKKELKGVGGWLLFLVVSLMILSPIRTVTGYYKDVFMMEMNAGVGGVPLWQTYKMLVIAVMAVAVALMVTAGYRLWKQHTWRSVRFAIMAMWMGCVVVDMLGVAVMYFVLGGVFAKVAISRDVLVEFVKGMVYPAIWTTYLLRSKRVANTYVKEAPMEEFARRMGMGR